MHSRTVKFEYPLTQIQEPIVSGIVKKFDVAPNILSANIDPRRGGWLVVELIGEAENIDQAVEWTTAQGVTVTNYVSPAV
jgi:ABC-type methionine transport system ATPase subunit